MSLLVFAGQMRTSLTLVVMEGCIADSSGERLFLSPNIF